MSGVKDGVDKVARDGDTDEELGGRGGYEGGAETGEAVGGAQGSGARRRGVGGYDGEPGSAGGSEGSGNVQRRIAALEKEIEIMKEKIKRSTQGESSKYELVNQKQMTPTILKDGATFRTWREEFERWSGLKVKGM